MVARKKRSISVPPDLDDAIEAAASLAGVTYSGWIAEIARKEFTLRAGLVGVAEYEQEFGAFTAQEKADADFWVKDVLRRGHRTGSLRPSRSA